MLRELGKPVGSGDEGGFGQSSITMKKPESIMLNRRAIRRAKKS